MKVRADNDAMIFLPFMFSRFYYSGFHPLRAVQLMRVAKLLYSQDMFPQALETLKQVRYPIVGPPFSLSLLPNPSSSQVLSTPSSSSPPPQPYFLNVGSLVLTPF